MVKGIATQNGYVLDDRERLIDLTYRDSRTPIVTYSEAWQNERQKARVTVMKKEKDGVILLEGAVFGLYSAEDITGENGKVILAKDTLIEQRATDSNGKLTFEVDLPVDFDYAIREITPPAGYASDPNAQAFTFDGSDTGTAVVEMEYAFEDAPTLVDVTKSSLTTGEELECAKLQVTDSDGNVIDSWTSATESHYIEMLPIGKYTLREETAPSGYLVAEDVEFEVKDTGEIQTVTMKDAEENPDQPGTPMPVTPKTGDMINPLLWGGVGMVALLGMMTAVLVMRKNRRKF